MQTSRLIINFKKVTKSSFQTKKRSKKIAIEKIKLNDKKNLF